MVNDPPTWQNLLRLIGSAASTPVDEPQTQSGLLGPPHIPTSKSLWAPHVVLQLWPFCILRHTTVMGSDRRATALISMEGQAGEPTGERSVISTEQAPKLRLPQYITSLAGDYVSISVVLLILSLCF